MDEKLVQSLRRFLEGGKDWERKPTSIPGIFIMKLPGYRKTPSKLAAEVNPVDSYGNPTKKRGVLIRDTAELESYRKLFTTPKLATLVEALERVNPSGQRRGEAGRPDVIEL
jgi:hypothetical protein